MTLYSWTEHNKYPVFPVIDCGKDGFYQVGSGCYTFTFYRSVTHREAEEFCRVRFLHVESERLEVSCQVSGGHLAVLSSRDEMDWIRRHLTDHVVGNICNVSPS